MNAHTPRPLPALALVAGFVFASAAQSQTAPVEQPPQTASPRDRIERITNEDALTRIDEVRVATTAWPVPVTLYTASNAMAALRQALTGLRKNLDQAAA